MPSPVCTAGGTRGQLGAWSWPTGLGVEAGPSLAFGAKLSCQVLAELRDRTLTSLQGQGSRTARQESFASSPTPRPEGLRVNVGRGLGALGADLLSTGPS